jgi:2-haloacid dehalogenase
MRLTDFKVLTFDCYGTLIDWETGILAALQPLLARAPGAPGPQQALEDFGELESRQEAATPTLPYSALLVLVHAQLAERWGVAPDAAADRAFGASVPEWPAFIDSPASLQYLKKYFQLVILSNVDRDSFAGSNRRLQVEFDAILTAQDIGSYKPSLANFRFMLDRMGERGFAKGEILHTAQSLFHDHVPAKEMGLATAWIDRRHGTEGWGATPKPPKEAVPDFRFTSLTDLVKAHQAALRGE